MEAKKCDRCGSFYIRKSRKTDNAVIIFGKNVFDIVLKHVVDGFDCNYCVDLCPKCMNDVKTFMEVKHVTPYIAKVEDDTEDEDPCHGCANTHCEQCMYGYKSLEE